MEGTDVTSSDKEIVDAVKVVSDLLLEFSRKLQEACGPIGAQPASQDGRVNAFIDRESCGRINTGQLYPGAEAVANEELTKLRAENAELANFVIAVGGFWGESKSVLIGETSLAACIQSAFDAAERTERLERTNTLLHRVIKARFEDTNRLRAEIEKYQAVCGAAYLCVGAFDGPVRFLDALSDAANGAPGDVEGLLPVDSPDSLDGARLDRAERALRRAGFTYTEGAQEWRPPIVKLAAVLDLSTTSSQQEVATVLVSNDGLDMELVSHIAFKLPDGFHRLYAIEKEES